MRALLQSALLMSLLVFACAELPDEAEPTEGSLAEAPPELALTRCRPNMWCNAQRAPAGYDAIQTKRNSLRADLRDAYFAIPTFNVSTTTDASSHFQWFTGPAGRGAIYNVLPEASVGAKLGTFYIYGAFFEEWARGGYEHGLGYFTDPVHYSARTEQLFEVQQEYLPSVANGGHLRTTGMLVLREDGTILNRPREEYLNSSAPGVPAFSPQPCEVWESYALDGQPAIYPEVSLDGYGAPPCGDTCHYRLWCGSREAKEDEFVPDV